MSAAERRGRPLDGVLLLDKASGITSQTAVTRARICLGAAKAGHTGTLDPMATGLLPIAFGEATKFTHALLDADKSYRATVRLGVTTTTGDIEGEPVSRGEVNVERADIERTLDRFRGEIEQTPPMFSAIKHQGKPLYRYARAGTHVVRPPRRVTIRELEVEAYEGVEVRLRMVCSKGTYVRVLAEDLGRVLGCGATLAALRRTAVGGFSVDDAVTLEDLGAMGPVQRMQRMLGVDALVAALPLLELDTEDARRIASGQSVPCAHALGPGSVRVYGPQSRFLGVAEATGDGRLLPRRLIATGQPKA